MLLIVTFSTILWQNWKLSIIEGGGSWDMQGKLYEKTMSHWQLSRIPGGVFEPAPVGIGDRPLSIIVDYT